MSEGDGNDKKSSNDKEEELEKAISLEKQNVFLTGKSYLIRYIYNRAKTKGLKCAITSIMKK